MTTGIGTGTTVAFTTSSWSGQITEINFRGSGRPVIEMAHMGSTGVMPKAVGDLFNQGQVELGILFDPESPPPDDVSDDTITITPPDGTTYVGPCAIISREMGIPLEDKMTGSLVVEFLGDITVTPSA